jgi:hypothetical protein
MLESTVSTEENSPVIGAIVAVLDTDPLSRNIMRFLSENKRAMDTAKGIASWWVQQDEIAVLTSLQHLFACGAIRAYSLTSGATIYGLTENPEVRAWLQKRLDLLRVRTRESTVPQTRTHM